MRKKFIANLIFLFTANLLVKPFWIFGIDRVVQNKVGPEMYGTYFAVFNYSFLLAIILDFGINNFNNRAVSRNRQRSGEYLLNLLLVKLVLAVIYFAITMAAAVSTGYSSMQLQMLMFLAANQILLSAILYFRSNIAALQLFKTDSFISILDRLLTIIFCLILMYAETFREHFNILWFIYAQTLALLLTAAVAGVVVIKNAALKIQLWKFQFTKLILLKSFPFALLALLMGIYYRIDGVMLERMLPDGAHEAGIYAASFRLLDAVNMFGYLFATLLMPMFAGMIRRKENVNDLVKLSAELMLVMSVIAGLSCFFFRNEMMLLLYPGSNPYWAKIFGWLMLSFIPISSVYIFGTLLTANGNLKVLNIIALGGMVLNVGLNLIFIPKFGAIGTTGATLFTQIVVAGLHIAVAGKQFDLSFTKRDIVRVVLFIISCWGTLLIIKNLPVNWMVSFVVAVTGCLLIAALTKLLPLHKALSLVKAKTGT